MTIEKQIGDYIYTADLLNLFDHHDFGERYSMILMSGGIAGITPGDDMAAAKIAASIPRDKMKELSEMKMTAFIEGKCRVRHKSSKADPNQLDREAFAFHFRDKASPNEMQKVLNWLLSENVKDFLDVSPSTSQGKDVQTE